METPSQSTSLLQSPCELFHKDGLYWLRSSAQEEGLGSQHNSKLLCKVCGTSFISMDSIDEEQCSKVLGILQNSKDHQAINNLHAQQVQISSVEEKSLHV